MRENRTNYTKVRKADIGCAPDDSTETFDSVLGNKVDYAG